MAITKKQGAALKKQTKKFSEAQRLGALLSADLNPKKVKLPKGWREDCNAVPLPFSRHWSEYKNSEAAETVQQMHDIIDEVGLEYLLEHLEGVCDEQAGLYADGLPPVFPKDEHLAGIWSYFAKRFRDMHKFAVAYQPKEK